MTSIALTTKAFDRATLAWSRDDASDNLRLMQLAETMLYAAIDLIISMECEIDRLNEEASETAKAERLLAIARKMIELGLEGEDPRDHRVAGLLEEAASASETAEDMSKWIRTRRRA